MAINCYCGLQGSGKSYESVSGPIMQAIEAGRNVVTNIDGINEEKIHEYLIRVRKADQVKLGHVIHVENHRVTEPAFFPDESKPDSETIVKGGDLVAIDEAWRFWPEGAKLLPEHMQFFRMHRHYVHPDTGVTCDVILMTQDISGLSRALKNVIEFSFKMHKIKSLGMNRTYRVELYEGWKQTKKTRVDLFVKKYDSAIFPLYKSYAASNGTEKAIDKRQNVLMNPRLWLVAAIVVMVGIGSIWGFFAAWRSMQKNSATLSAADKPKSDASTVSKTVSSSSTPATSNQPGGTTQDLSRDLRVVGELSLRGERWILLMNESGAIRLENPAAFVGRGVMLVGNIEGRRVATWSGGRSTGALIGGTK